MKNLMKKMRNIVEGFLWKETINYHSCFQGNTLYEDGVGD